MKTMWTVAGAVIVWLGAAGIVRGHCEIPCGIYGDQMRFDMLAEDIDTIEKSIQQIVALSQAPATPEDHNQLVRWIDNKERHADKIQDLIAQYFLTQRIKPVAPGKAGHQRYLAQLTAAHRLLVDAMKAKQTVDPGQVAVLRADLEALRTAYFGPHEPKPGHQK